ncbi:MAG: YibE/F family protein [Eubacterium sp.]|nr:YibE/F family protein [Eubacterium sp.]
MDKSRKRKVVEAVATVVGLIVLMITIWLVSSSVKKTPLLAEDGMEYAKGTVVEIVKGNSGNGDSSANAMAGSQDVKVRITSGTYEGKIVEANNLNGYLYGANCEIGTKVIVQISSYEDDINANVYNYDREYVLYALIGLFLIVLCVIGKRRGGYSAVALIFTFVCIIGLYLPLLYKGFSPFPLTILIVCLITIVSLLLIGGYTRKTVCAVVGTIMGVAVSGCIAMIFGKMAHISGYNTEDIENLVYVAQNCKLQIGDLLYSGILIASLGAVMDVAMSISSTIQEIYDRNPCISKKELFISGIHVGKDMMGTMSNTLILAFTGSSLNTMIMIYAYSYPYQQMINMYSIGIELLRGISGTIGIIMAVPFVSFIGSIYLKPKKEDLLS